MQTQRDIPVSWNSDWQGTRTLSGESGIQRMPGYESQEMSAIGVEVELGDQLCGGSGTRFWWCQGVLYLLKGERA